MFWINYSKLNNTAIHKKGINLIDVRPAVLRMTSFNSILKIIFEIKTNFEKCNYQEFCRFQKYQLFLLIKSNTDFMISKLNSIIKKIYIIVTTISGLNYK